MNGDAGRLLEALEIPGFSMPSVEITAITGPAGTCLALHPANAFEEVFGVRAGDRRIRHSL
jgi:hypothetical protein